MSIEQRSERLQTQVANWQFTFKDRMLIWLGIPGQINIESKIKYLFFDYKLKKICKIQNAKYFAVFGKAKFILN